MTKIVHASLDNGPRSKRRVPSKRVVGPDGNAITMYTVDAESETFVDDLSYVFRQNVKKARRMNKRLVGSPDRVAAD